MSARFCRQCNVPTDIVYEESLGHVVCKECGGVMEENAIVAEVTFSEKSNGAAIADGFQVQSGAARARSRTGKFGLRQGQQESRETTIQNGHRKIAEIANQPQIRMNARHIEAAQRFFNLAVINNFTKGRKLNNVAAACLYINCRMEKTAHMLIDFADALTTNVYVLGATYLKLVQLLHLNIPLIDPALYISRFANRLDFEDHTQAVIKDANRLVQRMNRDWIHLGRRPAGVCAACLYIAARMHGFNRTPREIVMVVKICEATLKTRLAEFAETPSGQLTVEDFQTIWLETSENPPAYVKQKTKKRQAEDGEDGEGDEDEEASTPSQANKKMKMANGAGAAVKNGAAMGEAFLLDDGDEDLMRELNEVLETDEGRALQQSLNAGPREDDANLSDLDDDEEVNAVIDVSPEEAALKKAVWETENKDWMARQLAKAKREIDKDKKPKKPRTVKPKTDYSAAESAQEATQMMIQEKKWSSKMNSAVLDNMFTTSDDRIAKFEGSPKPVTFNPDSVTGFGRYNVEDAANEDGADGEEEEGFVNGEEFVNGADLIEDGNGEEYYEEDQEEYDE
ncbi:transcription factor TFIIIB subunit brf1 [Rhizophlyctis rosea]|uniref:B-related factor 1 n=1 Tax=Rhizophlyctis rosea TaxID=64517 RepID=A0AAD5S7R4_9FUNG|nr:transcription factor TFIIIB subunit brf1 [Rhizophlyctis rosea]